MREENYIPTFSWIDPNVKVTAIGFINLNLDFDLGKIINWDFCVIEGIVRNLIGADLMQHYGMILNMETDEIEFNNEPVSDRKYTELLGHTEEFDKTYRDRQISTIREWYEKTDSKNEGVIKEPLIIQKYGKIPIELKEGVETIATGLDQYTLGRKHDEDREKKIVEEKGNNITEPKMKLKPKGSPTTGIAEKFKNGDDQKNLKIIREEKDSKETKKTEITYQKEKRESTEINFEASKDDTSKKKETDMENTTKLLDE